MVQKVPQSGISGNSSFRNLIINGDMSIVQREATQPGIQYSGYYSPDRWYLDISSAGTWTLAQSTTVPTGQGFFNSSKFDCTTADASVFDTVPDRCVTFISELRGAVPTIVTVVPDTVKSSVGSCTTPSIVINKAVSPRGALDNVNA